MTSLRYATSYGRGAGSARVRVFDWIDHLGLEAAGSSYLGLSSNGLGVLARNALRLPAAELRLRAEARRTDGPLLLSRQAGPFSNGAVEARMLRNASRGVYDFDDALMHSPLSATERIWSKRRIWRRSVEAADVVVAGNEFLAEEAERYARDVVIVPSCVEPDRYPVKQHVESDAPTAVWLGSPSTEKYLADVAEPLLAAHAATGLRLVVISAGEAPLGELDAMVDRVPWGPRTYAADLLRADFGIMPLTDDLWSRGKCAYKLLQYSAAGLPSIASPVGENARVLERAEGVAARTPAEWRDGLVALARESVAERARRGTAARAAVEQHYSFSAWSASWQRFVLDVDVDRLGDL